MSLAYKVVPYKTTKHHKAVVDEKEPWNDEPEYYTSETRFCVVSADTGEILDDAQGYGYKTPQKAHAGYAYKTKSKKKKKESAARNQHIRQWIKEHEDFMDLMEDTAVYIAKGSFGPDAKFDIKTVEQMLKDAGLEPDFTARELLKVWNSKK